MISTKLHNNVWDMVGYDSRCMICRNDIASTMLWYKACLM